jgi:hypothetical protein
MKALDRAEIERPKPVWIALSDLWLDTELHTGPYVGGRTPRGGPDL